MSGIAGCHVFFGLEANTKLDEAARSVNASLMAMDNELADAAENIETIAPTGLDSQATRLILADLYEKLDHVEDCGTVSAEGVLMALAPETFAEAEGADISDQEQIQRLKETEQPVLSLVFTAVEGFPALDLERPLFDESGEMIGSVSVLFKPEVRLGPVIDPLVDDPNWEIFISQTDGVIVYDTDPNQIGLNPYEDELFQNYPELVAATDKVVANKSGTASYAFEDTDTGEPVRKRAWWTTVSLHGTEWRVVVTRRMPY
jgi:hypothetical protein